MSMTPGDTGSLEDLSLLELCEQFCQLGTIPMLETSLTGSQKPSEELSHSLPSLMNSRLN